MAKMTTYWRVALVALVTVLVWVAHYDRWTLASWQIPTDYRGDALEVLTRIQAASEGDAAPLRPQILSRLGAPFGANWSSYPSSDLLLIWALGRVAAVIGVFPTANLAMLLATLSAALAFYGTARWLRVRWEWAFATALLFAFTYQTFNRGLPHLFLLFSWTVPLALLACGLVAASRRLAWSRRGAWFCLATALIIGVGNPYTLFLFLQLLGWALIANWLGPRRRENLVIGLSALGLALAAFAVVESHLWLFASDKAASSPLVRNYGGTELYALKPLELVLPPASHRWESLAFFGQRYERWSEWRGGEAFAPYLGLVGIIGLAWMAAATLRALLSRSRPPGVALPTGWVLAFSSVGGVTNIVAFFTGVVVFRATNRFSIFISAFVLLFLAGRLSRRLGRRAGQAEAVGEGARFGWGRFARIASVAAALVVTGVGLADQLARGPGVERQRQIAQRVESDRALGQLLEGQLPRGAMVFQLPVMMFPEVKPPHQLEDYEYFRPYLATRHLRFNYGSLKGRSRGRWQREADELPVAELVPRLERFGFAALYFNRRSFADRGEKVLAELGALGRTRKVEGKLGEQVIVFLEPAPKPELPHARSLTFGRGWNNPVPGSPRWAQGPATLSYFNPRPRPVRATIRLMVSAAEERRLIVRVNEDRSTERSIGTAPTEIQLKVELAPGSNRFDVGTVEAAVRRSQHRHQLRAFALHRSEVQIDVTGGPEAGL